MGSPTACRVWWKGSSAGSSRDRSRSRSSGGEAAPKRQISTISLVRSRQTPMRYVAYLRVSTDGQGRSGLGLEAQHAAVEQHAAAAGGRIVRGVRGGRAEARPAAA